MLSELPIKPNITPMPIPPRATSTDMSDRRSQIDPVTGAEKGKSICDPAITSNNIPTRRALQAGLDGVRTSGK
jgi:hypothetical protein